MKRCVLMAAACCLPLTLSANEMSQPKEPGFSGYVGVGAGYYQLTSNFFAGTRKATLGDERVNSLDGQAHENSHGMSEFTADLRYTFDNQNTQILMGNLIEDRIRLDWTQRLGVAHTFDGVGTMSASVLFSGIPSEVWVDPYQTEGSRDRTEQNSNGFRVSWNQIMGSNIGFNYSHRNINIDDEGAGDDLVAKGMLTPEEQKQLQRSGKNHHFELYGRLMLNERHLLLPSINLVSRERDGQPEQGETYGAQLTYVYFNPSYTLTLSGYMGIRDYDHANPIYDEEADAKDFGFNAMMFIHQPFELDKWDLRLGATYVKSNSDIDFYDNKLTGANIMMIRNF
ncbi:DUF2860 family protein [Ferrimonas lipolytica]|uniref:DUF2860 family protein n=1 Tax=Ferrimonas lipolytica TaxID=2724191 RepID=A0A6H1UGH5_9GAMM|nr:DUF2860 family protein [Ferrimonas lipolytica]QIZ77423.1 DUF2860 family protein [Ferrimonas lipolytica]